MPCDGPCDIVIFLFAICFLQLNIMKEGNRSNGRHSFVRCLCAIVEIE